MSGSVSSNNSAKLVRRSNRPASGADLDPQSVVRPNPLTDLIALSSYDEDSSDEESIDVPVQTNLPDREDGANSGDEFDHVESEFEEEEEEIEGDRQDFEDERLPSPVRVDPGNPLGPGLGPGIELVRIDNIPSQSTVDSIQDMLRGRKLLISEEDILIPTEYNRPWAPPDGFLCLYKSFFNASAVWFPLPKLLIEYCDRHLITISQLTHAAVRNIVTVLTLAAEIGKSVSCLEFEEMVQFKRKGRSGRYYSSWFPHLGLLTGCRTGFVLVLLRARSITSSLFLRSAENKTGRNFWNKELRGRFNLPLAPLRPFTLRIPKDRKPRSKKTKAQSGTMVKPERKVVKYTGTPTSESAPKYDKKTGKRAVDSSSLKPSSAIVPAKKQRGESFEKLDRQVEISKEMTGEAESARGRLKEAGNRLGMLRDQLEHEKNERDTEILLLKEENKKLKAAGSDVVLRTVQTMIGKALGEMRIMYEGHLDHLHQCLVDAEEVNRLNSLINQVNYSLELYAGLRTDGIEIPKEKIEKLQADLKSLNEEFDSLDVEVAKPEDYLVTPVADRAPLNLSSFQLDLGEGSRTRPAREDASATEEAVIAQDGENAQDEENVQHEGGEVDAIDASTNEELAPLFPSS
ncbi:hypothetical protein AALP_AA8G351700 [Arabis alpina]|uniref:Uncharacterized protein n=1 Tax=Arabis alpina TaxID=50452 RepID=A0A087GBF9_ARAAL|nr:hypothetical protein AALP_AA8G351700 [Arabis alpina]